MSTRTFRLDSRAASPAANPPRPIFRWPRHPCHRHEAICAYNGKVGAPPLKRLVERFAPPNPDTVRPPRCRRSAQYRVLSARARIDLEALTHPLLSAEMEAHCSKTGGPYQVFVIPLLVEQSLGPHLDRVVVVDDAMRRYRSDGCRCAMALHSNRHAHWLAPRRRGRLASGNT